ncbi:1,3-beta-D-glucan synthase [Apophysomyces ossiformis]|uniref:1,3-beta-glucan synthase n=1 Tax=Apophysomyces ossiformis TaxID=679940 RepID=A0A8H7ELE2_9FUNG|nr:1,3-beta-D-glucan synthase [Apophysomyces ossiformis]
MVEAIQSNISHYHHWNVPEAPVRTSEVQSIFIQYMEKFGFQRDNMYNMFDHLMTMLDSRASRMTPTQALWSLHADYIGGEHANYRKWYFVAQLNLDDCHTGPKTPTSLLIEEAKRGWRERMEGMSDHMRVAQLALFLLIWGEAAVLRYAPELLCFLFKTADDYEGPDKHSFLDTIVTPLYQFARNQSYKVINGECARRERDHNDIIGYDDINQSFWDRRAIARLKLTDGRLLKDIPVAERYGALENVDWSSILCKKFYETRSWMHILINFSRIWIIHATSFWYYMAVNTDFLYIETSRETAVNLSIVGLGGLVAVFIMSIATLAEFMYLPVSMHTTKMLLGRLAVLLVLAACHVGATVYVVWFDQTSLLALIIGACQLGLGAIVAILLAIIPSATLLNQRSSSHYLASKTFTASFPFMCSSDRLMSVLLWICVFACKFLETYFFLALSFRDAIAATGSIRLHDCKKDPLFGRWMCLVMPALTNVFMFTVEFVLFFLDTYLWYIVWNTMFSLSQAMRQGISVMASWKTLFARLPHHMYTKITSTAELKTSYLRKMACSQMWNAIVISMYREHLLSMNHLQSLLYLVEFIEDEHGSAVQELKQPVLFDPDSKYKKDRYFTPYSEAERRLSFFAQSLSTDIPEPCSVQQTPIFTVFTPHFAEKILLSLREIIREEDMTTRVTLLEYLKQLHPAEWRNFVEDTKFLAEEEVRQEEDGKDDLPFYCIGFKSSAPEYTLRTRIWASLRSQTLYRTVSGFMNYAKALKILHRIEHPELATDDENIKATEAHLDEIAHHKFRFVIAMQRYAVFDNEEAENCEFLLREYPHLQIAYIDEVSNGEGREPTYYSVLVDGHCQKLPNNKRQPRYRIRLPGNPILGDGKSDNQNHALIFYRGEYLQLVDANQDNYLEECLKIRSIFGEFEQQHALDKGQMYALHPNPSSTSPVAIVGAREYIFSENMGVLGDLAAGKEQTFGTLTQRIMARLGGRLHYGHPDFLNAVFMTTRGGVSKAQRGLHLNEDIYAGMTALSRGGRIKHTEYLQCGKGRDLGFCSILNFTTKIGTGMGEQLLSREYYYLGTQLPIDRFLTFYYAHPGFHINNIMIIFAIQAFLFCMMLVATMATSLPYCYGDGCFDIQPVYEWFERCVVSILIVLFISFLPLFLQELSEKGTWRSMMRLFKQFFSLSPLFEVFVTQIYATSVLSSLSFGGARYIATGRGLATVRLPFAVLYSRFATSSIYFGARTCFMLFFISIALWVPHLVYFWVTVLSLVISPFVFNPHQFDLTDFMTDYRDFLGWLVRGNNTESCENSWIAFCHQSRTRITGERKAKDGQMFVAVPRARFSSIFGAEILMPFLQAGVCLVCYIFVKHNTVFIGSGGALARVGFIALAPIIWNCSVLTAFQLVSVMLSLIGLKSHGNFVAIAAHGCAALGLIVFIEYFWSLESFNARSTLLGLLSVFSIQRLIFKTFVALLLTRELQHDQANSTWWTGNWWGSHVGVRGIREFMCKIVEMSVFTTDFFLGHLILFALFPLTLIPGIDRFHSLLLFWLRPSNQIRPSVLSTKQRRKRRRVVAIYGPLFVFVLLCAVASVVLPPRLMKKAPGSTLTHPLS